jgi:hypothetical protein
MIAMDHLPIQATSVPCERIFSSSAETDTKRRNRISPLLMEALQMMKYHYKKERIHFTEGWVTSDRLMSEDDPDPDHPDLLVKLVESNLANSQSGFDKIMETIVNDED